jgi:ribosomal protein L27
VIGNVNDKSNVAAEAIETRQRGFFIEGRDVGPGRPATQFPET